MSEQLKIWCDAITFNAQGKTAGTYDFETADTIEIKGNATEVIAILLASCITKPTAGISGTLILQYASEDLGIPNQRVVAGNIGVDPIGTNNAEVSQLPTLIPLAVRAPDGGSIGGSEFKFAVSTTSAQTEGYDGAVGLIFANGVPDSDYRMELLAMQHGAISGGNHALSAAGISAASFTAFTNTISIPATAKILMAILSAIQGNAATADDPTVGITEFTAPAIEDFQPQRWPTCNPTQGVLGTQVDSSPIVPSTHYPTRFPLPLTKKITVDVAQKCSVAQANAADGIAGMKWRNF